MITWMRDLIQLLRTVVGIIRRVLVRLRMRFEVRHVSGVLDPKLDSDDVIALITIKDGARYLPSFLEYHRKLGVRHFFFLDNGSSDETLALLHNATDATVIATALTYKKNDAVFAKYMVDRFARGRWSLTLDIDEYFDYPRSNELPLRRLVAYLDAHQYDALVTQMLDMYQLKYRPGDDEVFRRRAHAYYEVDSVEKEHYPTYYKSSSSNPSVNSHWGGVRQRMFGARPCLTKHALMLRGNADRCPDNNHFAKGARAADITGVLYHYKFISGFDSIVKEAVQFGHHYNNSAEYRKYMKVLETTDEVDFADSISRKFSSVDALVEEGFLVVTPTYTGWR